MGEREQHGVTIRQAVGRLEVSADTVKRWLKAGQREREVTPQGFRWLIHLPETGGEPSEAVGSSQTSDTSRHDYLSLAGDESHGRTRSGSSAGSRASWNPGSARSLSCIQSSRSRLLRSPHSRHGFPSVGVMNAWARTSRPTPARSNVRLGDGRVCVDGGQGNDISRRRPGDGKGNTDELSRCVPTCSVRAESRKAYRRIPFARDSSWR